MKIVVLGTGGTIAGEGTVPRSRPENDRAYTAATLPVAALLEGVALPHGAEVVTEQVAQLDSKDMDHATWQQLLARCRHWLAQDVAGIVITHGTDTLEETLFFLSQTLHADKPVVLTCAMRPATSREADGPKNLSDALSWVCALQADRTARADLTAELPAKWPGVSRGVWMVCAGQVHGADVQKVHATRLDAFASASGPIALRQADGSWLGSEKTFVDSVPAEEAAIEKRARACLSLTTWPRVDVVMSHAGATGAVVDALTNSAVPPQGLVVAATGNLTVHRDLQAALERATARGMPVVLASRCVWGGAEPMTDQSLLSTSTLSPTKARIALMLRLMEGL